MKYILFYSFVIVDYLIIFYISGNIAAVFAFLIMGGILLKTIIQLRKNWIFFNIPDIDISFLPDYNYFGSQHSDIQKGGLPVPVFKTVGSIVSRRKEIRFL